ncbi:MAG: alanine racemase [Armatimonadetes bacterium]|nr:alanine racemase [Armatimonadota bacterium]
MTALSHDAWVAVSRAALRHNVQAVRTLLAQGTDRPPQMIAVVKANAFGHGAGETARIMQEAGVGFFAVTTPVEAWELRAAGITGRILVFLPPLPDQADALVEAEVDISVGDEEGLRQTAHAARRQGKTARVHLKVDTGMGRLGILPADALPLARRIAAEPVVEFAGLYTHFARALEKDPTPTRRQFAQFQQVARQIEEAGIHPGLRHCANSAAMVRFPEMRLDAVRPGTALYGQYPSAAVPRTLDLQDTWRLQARVVAVRDVPAGTAVGYGGEYVTRRPTRLAVLPIGYADGFTVAPASVTSGWRGVRTLLRDLTGRGPGVSVTLHDRRAPVLGRVAMQVCTADVTDIPGVAVGDIATVPARRITASARLPRIYED